MAQTDLPLDSTNYLPLLAGDLSVGQVLKPFILKCAPTVSIFEAARRMSEARVSSILVTEGGAVLGIWTERDALGVDFADPAAFNRPVGEVMSGPVRSVGPDMRLQELATRFRDEHVRHYLVVGADDRPLGVVSQTDVVLNQGIEHYLRLRKVTSVIKGRLQLLHEAESLARAAALMRAAGTDSVIVDYDDGSYGILTERDVVRLIGQQQVTDTVGASASRPLRTVDEHTSLYRVRSILVDARLRHIGVTRDDGTLLDVVSFSDILAGMELAYIQELQTALRDRDLALNTSQRNLYLAERVIENSLEGIMITDPDAVIVSINPAFTRLTGYTAQEAVGRRPSLLSSGRHDGEFYAALWRRLETVGHWHGEIWNRRKNGEIYPELMTITAISDKDGRLTNYAALFSDISELKENEERIKHLAYYDPLTGMPNRRLFEDRLQVALAHAHRNKMQLAVMFVDLDRFKRINDTLGHEMGDQLLMEVSRRLYDCLREDDTVARMGGDEFVVLLSEVSMPDDAAYIARRITAALTQPMRLAEQELVVTASVGISIYPEDGRTASTLIKNADTAMYRAKESGRNGYQMYAPAMNARTLEHLALESALHKALERGELCLHYQPLAAPGTHEVVAAEALLRWNHPDLGLVPPADFIPLAEDTGLIIPVGEWVLAEACRQLRQWQVLGRGDINVAVNISARQFRDPAFVPMVQRVVVGAGIEPARLTLELTESMLMDEALDTIRLLSRLHDMGFAVAMDDFGTGYSSLSYLKRFPIDILKIDRVFIRDIERSEDDAAIVSAIIRLAHSLRLEVVAEGVETAEQLEFLQREGCDLLQGYYFSRPLDAAGFTELLHRRAGV